MKKDAAALGRGFLTMRFTGSQIHRDPDGCAQKIFDVVTG
jgi:very-short-patch-repair endonuclease